jgi:nicotinamide-nucleotide amidase
VSIISVKRLGFLATGSELTTGEILNTNGQKMAQTLLEYGVEIGEHLVVDDREENIFIALDYLFQRHDAIIVSGGLGPTSDDRTRFAISRYVGEELLFIEASWQRIVDRLSKRNIPIPENNRQQALFPKTAVIFPNINGTADGCYLSFQGKLIFMLPGPPRECLPMFKEFVLPTLETNLFYSTKRLYRWRLMGVSESAIAEELEVIGNPYKLEFAYRAAYPYIEVKLFIENNLELQSILSAVTAVVQPYLVTTQNASASALLKEKLAQSNICLSFCDFASKGIIAAELSTPETWRNIKATDSLTEEYAVSIRGLEEYWQNKASATSTMIHVELRHKGQQIEASRQIYLRGSETMEYAIEFTSNEILKAWFA